MSGTFPEELQSRIGFELYCHNNIHQWGNSLLPRMEEGCITVDVIFEMCMLL